MRMTTWHLECPACPTKWRVLCWDYELPKNCPECGTAGDFEQSDRSAGIATDEIPGGIEIKHGICNPDGSPKRYYSKTEIKRAANEAGYTITGDTPKPYKVAWSGQRKRIDGLKDNSN